MKDQTLNQLAEENLRIRGHDYYKSRLLLPLPPQWNALTGEMARLFMEGRHNEAIHVIIRMMVLADEYSMDDETRLGLWSNLGGIYGKIGLLAKAERVLGIALFLSRERLGERHPIYANLLNTLGYSYNTAGYFLKALPLFLKCLRIRRQLFGREHLAYTITLDNLAMVLFGLGRYRRSELLFRHVLNLRAKLLGKDNHDYATTLTNLAAVRMEIGDYASSASMLEEALPIFEKHSKGHPDYALALGHYADLCLETGDVLKARSFCLQSLRIRASTLGYAAPEFAIAVGKLADFLDMAGDHELARNLSIMALKILDKAVGKNSARYARATCRVASLLDRQDEYDLAVRMYKSARDVILAEKSCSSPDYAGTLIDLGLLYCKKNNYVEAEELYREAVNILADKEGEEHPLAVAALTRLGILYATRGQIDEALSRLEQAQVIADRMWESILSISSERVRLIYIKSLCEQLFLLLSVVCQCALGCKDATAGAFSCLLRRKAMLLDIMQKERSLITASGNYQAKHKLSRLRDVQRQIVTCLLLKKSDIEAEEQKQRIQEWKTEKERLELEVARLFPMRLSITSNADVNITSVAACLGRDTALVEYIKTHTYDFSFTASRQSKRKTKSRYLAFVLTGSSKGSPGLVDLGESEVIDKAVAEFRCAMVPSYQQHRSVEFSYPDIKEQTERPGTRLRQLVFGPLIPMLQGCTRIIIAPDGELSTFPFEALPITHGRYLINDYRISYVATGRDMMRPRRPSQQGCSSIIVADPDYDLSASRNSIVTARKEQDGRLSRGLDRSKFCFHRLEGAKKEGEAIARMLGVARPWFDKDAVEGRLKACRSPLILHIATHGFFLENQTLMAETALRGITEYNSTSLTASSDWRLVELENPMLRSGLVFAGVNTWARNEATTPDAEDGILTAEDVSTMDLIGTEMVVLSACETGLGTMLLGEGVFGLRRAFILAGVRTLIMSMWKVDDDATREIMVDFYSRILKGFPRSEALRDAQLAMKVKHPNPAIWGAFICQGDPGPIPGFEKKKEKVIPTRHSM